MITLLLSLGALAESPATDSPPDLSGTTDHGMETTQLLSRAIRAHGGKKGGHAALDDAAGIEAVYVRTVPRAGADIVARHRVFERGRALRVDIEIVEGTGKDSSSAVNKNTAWVEVDDELQQSAADHVRERLGPLSLASLYAIPLGIPRDMAASGAWSELVDTPVLDGERWVIATADNATSGLHSVVLSKEDPYVLEVRWHREGGLVIYAFSDYRLVGDDLVLPFRIEVSRDGTLLEETVLESVRLDAEIDPAVFAAPR